MINPKHFLKLNLAKESMTKAQFSEISWGPWIWTCPSRWTCYTSQWHSELPQNAPSLLPCVFCGAPFCAI